MSDRRDRAKHRQAGALEGWGWRPSQHRGRESKQEVGGWVRWAFHCLPKVNWFWMIPVGMSVCLSLFHPMPSCHLWVKWVAGPGG